MARGYAHAALRGRLFLPAERHPIPAAAQRALPRRAALRRAALSGPRALLVTGSGAAACGAGSASGCVWKVRYRFGRRRDARNFLEELWRNIGEEPGLDGEGGPLRDTPLVNSVSPPPVYLHFSRLGKGSGTGFSVIGLDSPGTARSICSASAVAGLHSVTLTDNLVTVMAGGHDNTGREVSAPISFSWTFGMGIRRGQWAATHGVHLLWWSRTQTSLV